VPKVLVIDDSVSVRKSIEQMLAPRGLQVASCASGYEAVARLRAEAPDLVICDLMLPDVDGYQICRWLRQLPDLAATPVLLTSSIVDEDVERQVARLGIAGVIRKPLAGDELAATAERILAAKLRPSSTPVADDLPAAAATPPAAVAGGDRGERAGMGAAATGAGRVARRRTTGRFVVPPASERTRAIMLELGSLPGFRYALLLSPAPEVLTLTGDLAPAAADLALEPLAGFLTAAAAATAALGLGGPDSVVLECGSGPTLLARQVDGQATLILVLADSASLGKARFHLGRLLQALRDSWETAAEG
jgi:twitching motility two-component system response regulator PilH